MFILKLLFKKYPKTEERLRTLLVVLNAESSVSLSVGSTVTTSIVAGTALLSSLFVGEPDIIC